MPQPITIVENLHKYGTLVGIVCIAYLQTLFPSRQDFEKLSNKFIEIDRKVTEITFVQTTLSQQHLKLVDLEIRLRQLELELVKVKSSFETMKK